MVGEATPTGDDAGDGGEEQGREQLAVRRLDHHTPKITPMPVMETRCRRYRRGAAMTMNMALKPDLTTGAGDGLDGDASSYRRA